MVGTPYYMILIIWETESIQSIKLIYLIRHKFYLSLPASCLIQVEILERNQPHYSIQLNCFVPIDYILSGTSIPSSENPFLMVCPIVLASKSLNFLTCSSGSFIMVIS